MGRIRAMLRSIQRYVVVWWNYILNRTANKSENLVLFDTSMYSDNLGDEIICQFCDEALASIIGPQEPLRIPTHILPEHGQIKTLPHYRNKIVCGTNLMTPHVEWYNNWKMPNDLYGYFDILTLAVGWGMYCDDISIQSKRLYRRILSKKGIHSVRDRYTEQKFYDMGICNVVYTGCVTLWNMTEEKCDAIPRKKASGVITTITDYDRNPVADKAMLDILFDHYDTVSVWIQGEKDMEYLKLLTDTDRITVVQRNLEDFRAVLSAGNVDYVGTRLHAGIFAMNHGIRSIIIAIDNRAKEMGKDMNLPIVHREQLQMELSHMIDGEWATVLEIPWDNIKRWKQQFID